MNEEIKGIDGISVFRLNTEKKEFYVLGQKFDGVNNIEDFINYITKLQQENDYYFKKNNEISNLNTSLRSARDDYKSRCEKAIEIYKNCKEEDYCILSLNMYEVLNGSDEK